MKETIFEILNKYRHSGQFEFHVDDNLRYVCNAPTDKSGVYTVWANEQLFTSVDKKQKREEIVWVLSPLFLNG